MAWTKGQSGNPRGVQSQDKPFRDALRMEIAQASGDRPTLRQIAARLLDKAAAGDIQAIMAIADRLDGKPAQESTVNVVRRRAEEMTDDELAAIAAGSGDGNHQEASAPGKLN